MMTHPISHAYFHFFFFFIFSNSSNNQMDRRKCNKCGSRLEAGTCTSCGIVWEESAMVNDLTFGESSSGAAIVNGSFVSADQSGPGRGGLYGNGNGREITIEKAKNRIYGVAHYLKVPEPAIQAAIANFKLALSMNFIRGRKSKYVTCACLYLGCRMQPTPHMIMEFASFLRVNVYVLGNTYTQLLRLLRPMFGQEQLRRVSSIDPSLYIVKFVNRLNLTGSDAKRVHDDAIRLCKRMEKDWMTLGRRPGGIAAAAILISCRMNNLKRSKAHIMQIAMIAESTIDKRLQEFKVTVAGTLSVQDFRATNVESAADPPPFLRNREAERLQNAKAEGERDAPVEDDENESLSDIEEFTEKELLDMAGEALQDVDGMDEDDEGERSQGEEDQNQDDEMMIFGKRFRRTLQNKIGPATLFAIQAATAESLRTSQRQQKSEDDEDEDMEGKKEEEDETEEKQDEDDEAEEKQEDEENNSEDSDDEDLFAKSTKDVEEGDEDEAQEEGQEEEEEDDDEVDVSFKSKEADEEPKDDEKETSEAEDEEKAEDEQEENDEEDEDNEDETNAKSDGEEEDDDEVVKRDTGEAETEDIEKDKEDTEEKADEDESTKDAEDAEEISKPAESQPPIENQLKIKKLTRQERINAILRRHRHPVVKLPSKEAAEAAGAQPTTWVSRVSDDPENLSDVDDDEVERQICTEAEVVKRKRLWMSLNHDYELEQAHRRNKIEADKQAGVYKEPRKRRPPQSRSGWSRRGVGEATGAGENGDEAGSSGVNSSNAQDVAVNLIMERSKVLKVSKKSKKINYGALDDLLKLAAE